jgi:hypothetical protein
MQGREIIFEYVAVGLYVKVSAIDVVSGLEVCVTTPRNAPRHAQQQLAINKLKMMLAKQNKTKK